MQEQNSFSARVKMEQNQKYLSFFFFLNPVLIIGLKKIQS